MTFDRNLITVWAYRSAFDNCVGNTTVDDGAKLNCLFEYCRGKAAAFITRFYKDQKLLKNIFGCTSTNTITTEDNGYRGFGIVGYEQIPPVL